MINSPREIEIIKIDERWAVFSVFNPKLFVLPFIGLCYENVRHCWRKLLPEASYISCLTSLSIFIDPGVFHNVNHKKFWRSLKETMSCTLVWCCQMFWERNIIANSECVWFCVGKHIYLFSNGKIKYVCKTWYLQSRFPWHFLNAVELTGDDFFIFNSFLQLSLKMKLVFCFRNA